MRCLRVSVFGLALACGHAQQEAPSISTLTVKAQIVALDAVVHSTDGERILDLNKDAFTLKVDGKPTPIRYFNRDNDLPLTIGLMVDTSGSQRVYFDEEALNSDNFLTNTLTRTGDRALVALFDARVVLLQRMTSRLSELHNALRRLDYVDSSNQGGTLLYDAIIALSATVQGNEPGRRALVVLTDGDDNGSRASLADAVRQCQTRGVAVYSVLYTREMIGGTRYPAGGAGMRVSGIDVMQQLAKATGGRSFVAGGGMALAQIFHEIEMDLRSQYRFGFTPPESPAGKRHGLELRTQEKRQSIQTRTSYYTPE